MSDNDSNEKPAAAPAEFMSTVTKPRADGLHIAFTRAHGVHDKAEAMAEAEAALAEDDAVYAKAETLKADIAEAEAEYKTLGGRIRTGYSRRYVNNWDAVFGKKDEDK